MRIAMIGGGYVGLADAVAILTEWDEFRALDLGRMKRLLKHKLP